MLPSYGKAIGNPFLAWTLLAWKFGEMSMASALVVACRSHRMAVSGPLPNARDRKEFTRMGQEKFEAVTESAQAIAEQMSVMSMQFGLRAWRDALTGTAAWMSLATSRDVGKMSAHHAVAAGSIDRFMHSALQLSDSTVKMSERGLHPIHSRATANARRLIKG